MIHIFKHKIHTSRSFGDDKTFEFHNVWMVKPTENDDLSSHEPHTLRIHIRKPNLLQRDDLVRFQITSSVHIAIRPLPNLQSKKKKTRISIDFSIIKDSKKQRFLQTLSPSLTSHMNLRCEESNQ